jgi:GH24 family phage-related lysozyme (muramidase)
VHRRTYPCRLGCQTSALVNRGFALTDTDVHLGLTITQEQAEELLANDIHWAANVVSNLVHISLTQGEFDSLTDFVFNVGAGNFANSTMLKFCKRRFKAVLISGVV